MVEILTTAIPHFEAAPVLVETMAMAASMELTRGEEDEGVLVKKTNATSAI